MSIWRLGAIQGRHPLPVKQFLFPEPNLKVDGNLVVETRKRVQALYRAGMRECEFYATGLGQVNVEAVAEMHRLGIKVMVFHWDKIARQYYFVPDEEVATC